MVSLILVTPIAFFYLDAELFAIWVIVGSFSSLLAFADFGIGLGVLNLISEADGQDDKDAVKSIFSTAFLGLLCLSSTLLIIFGIIQYNGGFTHLIITPPSGYEREVQLTFSIALICLLLNIPLSVVQRVQTGLQLGYQTSIWQALATLASLLCSLLAYRLDLGFLIFTSCLTVPATAVLAVNNIVALLGLAGHVYVRLSFKHCERGILIRLASLGFFFLVTQLSMTFTYRIDPILIHRNLGADAVAQFAVTERIFALLTVPLTIVLAQFWPAYREASARSDWDWVRRTALTILIWTVLLSSVAAVALSFSFQTIMTLWIGPGIIIATPVLAWCAAWKVIEMTGTSLSMALNGLGIIKLQALLSVIIATLAFTIKITFLSYGLIVIYTTQAIFHALLYLLPASFILIRYLQTKRPRL
jgi:O-antigen/teichoic acid export membrane protein